MLTLKFPLKCDDDTSGTVFLSRIEKQIPSVVYAEIFTLAASQVWYSEYSSNIFCMPSFNIYWKPHILPLNKTDKQYASIKNSRSKMKVSQFYTVTLYVCMNAPSLQQI